MTANHKLHPWQAMYCPVRGILRHGVDEIQSAWLQASASVAEEPGKHSLLTLPHPAVVAGDRFREVYYWDSFFIVRGLLVSGMKQTAMVRTLGYIGLTSKGIIEDWRGSNYRNCQRECSMQM